MIVLAGVRAAEALMALTLQVLCEIIFIFIFSLIVTLFFFSTFIFRFVISFRIVEIMFILLNFTAC